MPDDRRAMREFARVLKPTGWAVFLLPMKDDITFEDPSITDPVQREKLFSHPEHVRRYGTDFADRLESSSGARTSSSCTRRTRNPALAASD